MPDLVDVRGRLARLLVARGRPYGALSLLVSYDADAAAKGRRGYFEGQRIAIESTLATVPPSAAGSLRLPVMDGHFYAPVALGDGKPLAFMVDTGASAATVTPGMLDEAKADYRVVQPVVTMTTADGRQVAAQGVEFLTLTPARRRLTARGPDRRPSSGMTRTRGCDGMPPRAPSRQLPR